MRRNLFFNILFIIVFSFSIHAQNEWRYINKENINFKMPENWKMINSSKPHGDICIKIYDPSSAQFVEIRGINSKINLKVRVNDIATIRSNQQYFEYMQIDKVQKSTFNNFDAQLLNYTNTFLNDVYKGSIYSFVKEGYTYSVEYYGEDLPKTQSFLSNIASTVNINSADKKENITKKSETYIENNWSTMEIDNSAELAAMEEARLLKIAQKEEQKALKKERKELEKQEKQERKQEKEERKQEKELEKQQKLWDKQQAKAEKQAEALANKQAKAEQKALKAEQKRIEKENSLPRLRKRNKNIDKELNKIANRQLKLSEQYGKVQMIGDEKKMEKIQKEQSKLSDRVNKLTQEKYEIEEKLSKF